MNVLIYGASNVIAIGIARLLDHAGHFAILSDTNIFARAFYSRYCFKKHLFREPVADKSCFADDLSRCIEQEGIDLVVPTTDEALLDLVEAKDSIPRDVILPFPSDIGKLKYVLNKANLPEICRTAGVRTPLTIRAKEPFVATDVGGLKAPFVVKKAAGLAGEGFVKVERFEMLGLALSSAKKRFPGDDFLVQEYIDGKVYGAGGIFDGRQLRHFYSYEYVNRYPLGCGPPTMCRQQNSDAIDTALEKVLAALQWHGYCQMDFLVDKRNEEPYLIDINPVHWYTMPFLSSENMNCLSYYLRKGQELPVGQYHPTAPYATICLSRELQRLLAGGSMKRNSSGSRKDYWRHFNNLSRSDFYWDPLPVVLAPVMKFLKFVQAYRR